MLRSDIMDDIDALAGYLGQWDDLAVRLNEPYCSPGWMLPWWNHMAPHRAKLRIIVVTSGRRIVGLAPLFVDRLPVGIQRYRLLGAGLSGRLNLLAEPGREGEVAAQFAATLASSRPTVHALLLEGIGAESPWPELLRASWPNAGRVVVRVECLEPEPIVTLEGAAFDDWFAGKTRHFRQQMRRRRRAIEQAGASFSSLSADAEPVETVLADLVHLHRQRWKSKSGSTELRQGVERMLLDSARSFTADTGRLRLWWIHTAESSVACLLGVAAGEELALWNHGFSENWGKYSPAALAFLSAVEGAASGELRRISFGPGDQPIKYRFADTERSVAWITLVPHMWDVPIAALQQVRIKTRVRLAKALSRRAKSEMRRVLSFFRL